MENSDHVCASCGLTTHEALAQLHGNYISGFWCQHCMRFTFLDPHEGHESLLLYPAFVWINADQCKRHIRESQIESG